MCDPRKNALLKAGNKSDRSDAEGTGAQLYDHHQRSDASDGSTEGAVQKLGHSLYWPTSLRGATGQCGWRKSPKPACAYQ
jgi:hypothetical protein